MRKDITTFNSSFILIELLGLFLQNEPIQIQFPEPIEIVREAVIHTAEASEPVEPELTLREMAYWASVNGGVSWTRVRNILDAEHYGKEWDASAVSPTGDYGLSQINLASWPNITKEQALDPEFSLKFLVDQIKKGNQYYWTSCSCVKQIRALGIRLPKISTPNDLNPNSMPKVGSVALLRYSGGIPHMGKITKMTKEGFYIDQANKEVCKRETLFIKWGAKEIRGYWSPALNM